MTVASSIRTTVRKTARHPAARHTAWILGIAAAGAALVGGAVYYSEKSASAATKPTGPTVPVWTRVRPDASGNVQIPANATFAFADPENDPNLTSVVAQLNAGVNAGSIGSPNAYAAGSAAPANWPNDGMGTSGYRVTGVALKPIVLQIGTVAGPPMVWIISGFTS